MEEDRAFPSVMKSNENMDPAAVVSVSSSAATSASAATIDTSAHSMQTPHEYGQLHIQHYWREPSAWIGSSFDQMEYISAVSLDSNATGLTITKSMAEKWKAAEGEGKILCQFAVVFICFILCLFQSL